MAVVYYPKNSIIVRRDTISSSFEELVLSTHPNVVLYFNTASGIEPISLSMFVDITCSYALTASFAKSSVSSSWASASFSSSYVSASQSVIGTLSSSFLRVSFESASLAPPTFTVVHINGQNSNPATMVIDTNNSSSNLGSIIKGRRSRGTSQSASAIFAEDILLQLAGDGATDGANTFTTNSVNITLLASQNWNTSSSPTYISFRTTNVNSTLSSEAMRITESGSLVIGNATSSAKLHVQGDISASAYSGSHFGTSSFSVTASFAVGVPTIKTNQISGALFLGTPRTSSVVFTKAYPSNLYSVAIDSEASRTWTIQTKSPTGFTINSNSNTAFTGMVFWTTVLNGEFYG